MGGKREGEKYADLLCFLFLPCLCFAKVPNESLKLLAPFKRTDRLIVQFVFATEIAHAPFFSPPVACTISSPELR